MTSLLKISIFFLFCAIKPACSCLDDECRELDFPEVLNFYGERLINHEIRTVNVLDQDSCELSCYFEHNCVSINLELETTSSGSHKCDLNNSTHKEHGKDLVKAGGYLYHGTENACGKAPCQNNGTCQSGFTSKRYRCLCTSGFIGHDCEHDERYQTDSTIVSTPAMKQTTKQPAAECQNYQILTDTTRKTSHAISGVHCDNFLGPGWFRFQNPAGTKMPTSCVPKNRCGTHAPGWLNGAHPKVTEGKVSRQVCFHWNSNCCRWSVSIQVRNCGSFYIYYLNGAPACNLRFCGTGYP